ncbi:MAG: energy transducer TonB, partial [FCB group bacterium]|nr:energy transducer TonB [FCB group bacterium]
MIRPVLYILTGLCLIFPAGLSAQTITGRITDAQTGEPLMGANILVQHTFLGTASDQDGQFRLDKLPASATLVITMMGYQKEKIPVKPGENQALNIALKRDVLDAPQVVVTASRMVQDVLESPVSISVITPLKIREQAAIT